MTPKLFSELILLAQEIRDTSWNHKTRRHRMDQHDAALAACLLKGVEPIWAWPLELLNGCAWNDIQNWARETMDEQEKTS